MGLASRCTFGLLKTVTAVEDGTNAQVAGLLAFGCGPRNVSMLEVNKCEAPGHAVKVGFDVEVLSVATANRGFQITQADAAARVKALYPRLKRLWPLFDNTGIDIRYNCEPVEWYLAQHSWEERTASFHRNAVNLLEQVTLKAIASASVDLDAIDMIITNTVTGLAIPSLDALLFNRLEFVPNIERLPMFGLGCGAGVAGLARATRMAHAADGAHVLFLTVDLCSLCLRVNDPSPAMFVSSALFGDGAAGVLVHNTRGGSRGGPRILASGEWCWRKTEHIMGWDIKDDGFGVVLSPELPSLMSEQLAPRYRISSVVTASSSRTSMAFYFIRVDAS